MKKSSPLLLTALLCGPLIFALRPQASTTDAQELSSGLQSDVSVDENVSYSSTDPVLRLDVYKPIGAAPAPRPAVLLIHGGGWTGLEKSTMQGLGSFLARHGYVAFSVDYRLFADGKNSWPAQLDDVQRAVRWIRANAAKYDVDPNHIGAFGHSAADNSPLCSAWKIHATTLITRSRITPAASRLSSTSAALPTSLRCTILNASPS
jgi:acetyl esterase/lipase